MNKLLIRELPVEERPRERLVKYGARNLSTEDLIAIILKTGTKDYSSKYLNHLTDDIIVHVIKIIVINSEI